MKIFVENSPNLGSMSHQNEMIANFIKYTRHTVTNRNPDIAWAYSMPHIGSLSHLRCKKVATIHHIYLPKVREYLNTINAINLTADAVVVPNYMTLCTVKKYIRKPIYKFDYWLMDSKMAPYNNELNVQFDRNETLIGYFQKDSEGDSDQPKLCKGPDIFLEIVTTLSKNNNIRVILSSYARKYIVKKLTENNIKFTFFEQYDDVNKLYDICDWYFITSRTEGGPIAVLETAYRKVKVLSSVVGIAPEILHPDCLCHNTQEFIDKFNSGLDRTTENYNNILNFTPDKAIARFDNLLELIHG